MGASSHLPGHLPVSHFEPLAMAALFFGSRLAAQARAIFPTRRVMMSRSDSSAAFSFSNCSGGR